MLFNSVNVLSICSIYHFLVFLKLFTIAKVLCVSLEVVCFIILYKQPNVVSHHVWTFADEMAQMSKKESEYDQEIPQSHTADQPTAPWGRAT